MTENNSNRDDLALAFGCLVGVLVLMVLNCAVQPATPSEHVPPAVRKARCIRDGRIGQ